MRVLDLFSGQRGWSAAFTQRGHEVVTVELNRKLQHNTLFDPNAIMGDITVMTAADFPGQWDIILASPPCQCFSVASIGRYWESSGVPRTDEARRAQELVGHTLRLIRELKPRAWVMENPRAMLRKLPVVQGLHRETITFCQYGENRQKPTDLWGEFPRHLKLRPACPPRSPCHEAAPRGAKTGTQGLKGAAERAVIPYGLSLAVCVAMEEDLAELNGGAS